MKLFQRILLGLLGIIAVLYFGAGSFIYQKCDVGWQVKLYSFLNEGLGVGVIVTLTLLTFAAFLWTKDKAAAVGILLIGGLVFLALLFLATGVEQRSARNLRRVSDLRQAQHALEVYYRRCGYYPGKADETNICGSRGFSDISRESNSWAVMTVSLTAKNELGFAIIPNDPNPEKNYFYKTNSDGTTYVLGAELEGWSETCEGKMGDATPLLQNSYHGEAYGLQCETPMYCIKY
jgi:hypothetical protein